MKNTFLTFSSAALLMSILPAHAALEARYLDADATPDAYYDSHQDVTWLKDAGAIGGQMLWSDALSWAGALNIGGITGWRLPTTAQPDTTCSRQGPMFWDGTGCKGSEMGYLANVESISHGNPGPFANIAASYYWSGTAGGTHDLVSAPAAWVFFFVDGSQTGAWTATNAYGSAASHFAWAVHDGSVGRTTAITSNVPEPETYALMLAGLGAVGLMARRRKA